MVISYFIRNCTILDFNIFCNTNCNTFCTIDLIIYGLLILEQFVEKSSCHPNLGDLPSLEPHGDFSSGSGTGAPLCTEPLIPTDKFHDLGTEMIITKSGR